MNRSAQEALKNDPALLPADDGARAVMILGSDNGAAVELRIQALTMEDTAAFGTGGVYLQITGTRGSSLARALAAASKMKDQDVCLYLNKAARENLAEQLARFQTILSLHAVMARQELEQSAEQKILTEMRARAGDRAGAGARRSRAILRGV